MQETRVQSLGQGDPLEGNGNPLQYPCLKNSMGRGAWWAAVHVVTKSQTRLSNFHSLTHPSNFSEVSEKMNFLSNVRTLVTFEGEELNF